jgi:hypothetical protein
VSAVYVVCGGLVAAVAWYRLTAVSRGRRPRLRGVRRGLRAGIGVLLNAPEVDATIDSDATIGVVYELLGIADATWRQRDLPLSRPGAVVVRDWAFELGESAGGIAGIDGEPQVVVIDSPAGNGTSASVRVQLRLRIARRERFARPRWIDSDTRWTLAGSTAGWRPVGIEPYRSDPPIESALE